MSIDVLAEFANPLSSALSQRHVEEALFSLLYKLERRKTSVAELIEVGLQ